MARADSRGGRRNGAGRPPGKGNRVAGADLSPSRHLAHVGRVANLAAIQRAAVLRADHCKIADIAQIMNVTPRTIQRWLKEHPEAVYAAVMRTEDDPKSLARPLVPYASSRYREALVEGSLREAIPVAKDVLDRHYGKPVVRQAQDVRTRIQIVYCNDDGSPIEFPPLTSDEPPEGE